MQDLLSIWGLFIRTAVGFGMVALLLFFAQRTISQHWRKVAEHYAGQPVSRRLARRFPETVIVTGRVAHRDRRWRLTGWHAYAAVRMDLHDDYLALSMILPFSVLCPPLLLPVAEMELDETWWLTLSEPVAIRMRRTPDIDMIVRGSAAQWLRDALSKRAEGIGVPPAFGRGMVARG